MFFIALLVYRRSSLWAWEGKMGKARELEKFSISIFIRIHSWLHPLSQCTQRLSFNCWFELEKANRNYPPTVAEVNSQSHPTTQAIHLNASWQVIKRNCNNMDLISNGNKHRENKHQIIKGKKMKNWSRLERGFNIKKHTSTITRRRAAVALTKKHFCRNHDLFCSHLCGGVMLVLRFTGWMNSIAKPRFESQIN